MAGISSKAAGSLENKKKYNGIEFENDLDLNTYDAFFRELDPQIGRWWQIDPATDDMEQWSQYASNYDNPITYSDPLGDIPEDGNGDGDPPTKLEKAVTIVKAVVTIWNELTTQTTNDVLTFTAGVATGATNTVTFGFYHAAPVPVGGSLTGRQQELFNNGVTFGQILPLFSPRPNRTPTPSGNKPAM